MKARIPILLLLTALGFTIAAIVYDANFAGIPFQDATRDQMISYAKHSRVCASLMYVSAGFGLLSLLTAILPRLARLKRHNEPSPH
jgi:hypothetical protein